uniref:Eukaryotic translation initiation factor 4E family member 1B n=1 Tax=Monodelphis domestica TaxID=13616 RepID=A0A5F8HAM8_MONDO
MLSWLVVASEGCSMWWAETCAPIATVAPTVEDVQTETQVLEESPKERKLLLGEGLEKHPLENRWALWFFKNDRNRAWQDNLHLVTKFETVEDFWAIHSHIKLASKLSSGCDYALFKDGIEPMWEDSRNKHGGRWLVSLAKQQHQSNLDRLWLEMLLCLIGGGL